MQKKINVLCMVSLLNTVSVFAGQDQLNETVAIAKLAKTNDSTAVGSAIGFIDMQRVMQSVSDGKKVREILEKEMEKKQKEFQAERQKLGKMAEELQKQSGVMTEAARTKKQSDLQERIAKFEENVARSQMELQQQERELFQPILLKVKAVASELARKNKYKAILDESAALYMESQDNLTADAILLLDRK
jgi:outer membrane protein